MKTFFGRVLAVIVGISIFIYLLFLFFTLLGNFLSNDEKVSIDENSILKISLDKEILESPYEADSFLFNLKEKKDVYLYNVLKEIDQAKDDNSIKGIFLDLESPSVLSLAKTDQIRKALIRFKESGKFIYAYTNRATQNTYYLASVADSIFHHPMGLIELKGLGSEVTFYKDMGDKYGVEFEIIRHGKYKSAIEPFIRNDLSNENKFQIKTLLDDFWNQFLVNVSKSRSIPVTALNNSADALIGFSSEASKKNKLVDVLAQKDEVYDFLKQKVKVDDNNLSFSEKHIVDWLEYTASKNSKFSKNKIAILYAGGNIMPGDGRIGIQSEVYIKAINELINKKNVKAVVLRINSGGGDAVTSDEILYHLKKLQSEKPVVISFGDVAASGGYYIAQTGDKIFAEDFSVTGSIGVFGMIPNAKGLANSIGITSDTVATNKNSLYYSPLLGLTPMAKEKLTESVEETYNRFVSIVSEGRKMSVSQVDSLSQGRVYTASQALKVKLIDELGGIEDAINYAAKTAELEKFEIEHYPKVPDELEALLKELDLSTEVSKKIIGPENTQLLKEYIRLHELKKINGIQMWWPYHLKL